MNFFLTMNNRLLSSIFYFILIINSNGQDLCAPGGLNANASNQSISFTWDAIGSNPGEIIFLECFALCGLPTTATVVHEIDNGNGGWYRNQEGEYYCWVGPDCDLSPYGQEWAALGSWSAPGTPVDSRMIFGPFDLPENSLATLGFLESYMDGEYQVVPNTVEISTDNGESWQSIYTSDPIAVGTDWTPTPVDLSNYSGQSVHISFRYKCTEGWAEAWLIDHVAINVVNNMNALTVEDMQSRFIAEGTLDNHFLSDLNKVDREAISTKSISLKGKDRTDYKPNYFIPVDQRNEEQTFQIITNNRDCADPENESEISLEMTAGDWAEEISWSIVDDVSGEEVLSGIAPDAMTQCVTNGVYTLYAVDSYGDGWNNAVMTIQDVNEGLTYLNYTMPVGPGGNSEDIDTLSFYIGANPGCTNEFAENYDPYANIDDGSCIVEECDQNELYVNCTSGDYPEEVSWYIEDESSNIVSSGFANETYLICVPDGNYKAVGLDTYGDGWNNAFLNVASLDGAPYLSWTFNAGFIDSVYFYVGSVPGCMDPAAENYNPDANVDDGSCEYANCFQNQGYLVYLDGQMVGTTGASFYNFNDLDNGREYELGVVAVYNEGESDMSTLNATPWNRVVFDPVQIELDTITNNVSLEQSFTFSVSNSSMGWTTPFTIDSPNRLDVDNPSFFISEFNSGALTNMYDPSGIFGGLWQVGDGEAATSDWFYYPESPDNSTFAWINDDMIGAGGAQESAYLITEEITIDPLDRIFITFDLFFPQPYGSCAEPDDGSGVGGEGFSEDLFLMVSGDYGVNWTVVDSTMGTDVMYWVSKMYDLTDEIGDMTNFIIALYYTDCNGNWAFGVGVDNFEMYKANDNEIIAIDPYAGWIDVGVNTPVTVSFPNDPSLYNETHYLQLTASYETINVPVVFGLTPLDIDHSNDILPNKYILKQNYPNPFNPTTVIPFRIPETAAIQLTIYNLLGERVNTLVNDKLNPGTYKINWHGMSDAGHQMPAGLYFYELRSHNFRDTGKMLLLK
tara:strand:+ start:7967 stop:11023 length:3057 start_codon:yes stop_codon:yes gene_type:complete